MPGGYTGDDFPLLTQGIAQDNAIPIKLFCARIARIDLGQGSATEAAEEDLDIPASKYFYVHSVSERFDHLVICWGVNDSSTLKHATRPFDTGGVVKGAIETSPVLVDQAERRKFVRRYSWTSYDEWFDRFASWARDKFSNSQTFLTEPPTDHYCAEISTIENENWYWEVAVEVDELREASIDLAEIYATQADLSALENYFLMEGRFDFSGSDLDFIQQKLDEHQCEVPVGSDPLDYARGKLREKIDDSGLF